MPSTVTLEDGDVETTFTDYQIALSRPAPRLAVRPTSTPPGRILHRRFAPPCAFDILFHMAGADAAAVQNFGKVRVLHGMDISNVLPLAHLANGLRGAKVFNVNTGPAFMGNAMH
ncbi:MAG: hypothetical protein HC844_02780 [Tabrizicola sp.]|nr:hypothetical protein [Tabrizicola sp.]